MCTSLSSICSTAEVLLSSLSLEYEALQSPTIIDLIPLPRDSDEFRVFRRPIIIFKFFNLLSLITPHPKQDSPFLYM